MIVSSDVVVSVGCTCCPGLVGGGAGGLPSAAPSEEVAIDVLGVAVLSGCGAEVVVLVVGEFPVGGCCTADVL